LRTSDLQTSSSRSAPNPLAAGSQPSTGPEPAAPRIGCGPAP
jgi:hypothetical protein